VHLAAYSLLTTFLIVSQHLSWVPIDVAASAVLELRHAEHNLLNLVHPRPIEASTVSRALSTILDLPVVPYVTWLSSLEALSSADSLSKDGPASAFSLLEFFRNLDADGRLEVHNFDTDIIRRFSPIMQQLVEWRLESLDVKKWVGYWKNAGYLK
jgi:hypothetical protein